MLNTLICLLVGLPAVLLMLHTVVRIVRYFYKFPMPEFLANAIDNPLRRKMQPPAAAVLALGIEPGMNVLEVGPGNGTYTLAAAQRVGTAGKVTTIDIEPRMIERVKRRLTQEQVTNVEARVANVHDLPFADDTFDAIYMIAVIGEIPHPQNAIREFQRVLKPGGILAFSEVLTDPDYTLPRTLIRWAEPLGFHVRQKTGSFALHYLIFENIRQLARR